MRRFPALRLRPDRHAAPVRSLRARPFCLLILLALLGVAGCFSSGAVLEACLLDGTPIQLPPGLEEVSGVAVSRTHPGVRWLHNDSGGDPELFAVDGDGVLIGRTRLLGAEAHDWEDLALAPCPSGSCLWVADTGGGSGVREEVDLYRVPEPDPVRHREVRAERYPARFPNGARDTEAIFVLPGGGLHLVTKGRVGPVEIYRYPPPLRVDEMVTLERLLVLADSARPLEQQVTGASASPSGEWVAIRTYGELSIYRAADLLGGKPTAHSTTDLRPVGEAQGEAVALLDDGTVVLASEGGFLGAPGSVATMRCTLP